MWYNEKAFTSSRYSLHVMDKVIRKEKSKYQTIELFDNELFGKVLALDGIYQTSIKDEFYYHEMIVHPALKVSHTRERVLIIGGGDLGTARRVLQYPEVEHVDLVEIDENVVDICEKVMPEIGGSAWDDERLYVKIMDGVEFLKDPSPQFLKYNVIIVDGSDPVGPAEVLVTEEFYRDCYNILEKDGILITQSGSPFSMKESFYKNVKTLQKVFDDAYPYFSPVPLYTNGNWSYIMAIKGMDLHPLGLRRQHIKTWEKIKEKCKYYNEQIHTASFTLPEDIKRDLFPEFG